MNKKSLFLAGVLVLCLAVILTMAAGCTRPKPEPKLTPTATVITTALPTLAPASVTPAPGVTTTPAEPTVVTTKPGSATAAPGQPTSASGAMAAATPTPVVLATVPAASSAGPTALPTAAGRAPTAAAPASGEVQHTVQSGDTLYSLAARYGTTVEAIVALNKLTSPDRISAGMTLRIPKGSGSSAGGSTGGSTGQTAEYVVQAGDNMSSIAVRFGVSVDAILKANSLSNPDFVYPGQKLTIPAGGSSSGGSSPKTHVVKAGETLGSIAAKYGVTAKAIMDANQIANPNLIYPGQTLHIP
jgi:LysM repeat protein